MPLGAQGPPDHAGNKTIPPVKNKVTVDKVSGEICIEGENSQRPLRPGLIFS